jgi:Lysyl oxidase
MPAPTPTRTVPQLPPLLLPNMRSLGASDLQIEVVGSTRRLRFAASLANVGPGPLFLLPRGRGRCGTGQHEAVQVLHRDANRDGKFQRSRDREGSRRVTGCMLRHPGHKHWHCDAMAAYSLRRADSSRVLVSRNKVSFCLRDNLKVPGQRVVVPRRHFGRCSRNSQQGISPGWVDIYKADLSGQWLRLPSNVGSEILCLDLEADPLGRLVETNETDNATSVAIRVDGTRVRKVSSAACR